MITLTGHAAATVPTTDGTPSRSRKNQTELRKIKKEMADLKKRMDELEARKTELEKQIRK